MRVLVKIVLFKITFILKISLLEVVSLNKIPPVPFCKRNPYIYMDIGFATGVPIGRVEIQLNEPMSSRLTENMVKLCTGSFKVPSTGKTLSLSGSPLQSIDNVYGIITFGQVLPSYAHFGGFAANEDGLVRSKIKEGPPSDQKYSAGTVVMLPKDTDASLFTSVFYITTQPMPIYDGKVIGNVINGLEVLSEVVDDYGSCNGVPKKTLYLHTTGQI